MTPEELIRVLAAGESLTVEFKRGTAGALNDRELIEAAMCLTNGPGGLLLIGVEDDGAITGAAPRHGDHTDPQRLAALILNRTLPPLSAGVEIVAHPDGDVLVIDVPAAPSPTGTREGVFKRRSIRLDGKPECIPYAPHEMFSDYFSMQRLDYAEVVARGAGLDDLDPQEFQRYRALAGGPGADPALALLSDLELARALGVVRALPSGEVEVTLGAVLLFGTEQALGRYVPNQECAFQVLDEAGRVTTNDILRVPLIRAATEIFERVRVRNPEQELDWGLFRVPIRLVPEIAVREAIVNAMVHRDYAETGMTVVQMTPLSLTVRSPGGFLPGVTLANLTEVSRPRSRILADAFKRAGLAERTGRGISRMYSALLRVGRDGPDFSQSSERLVCVELPTTHADLAMVRFILGWEQERSRTLSLLELRVLHEVRLLGAAAFPELVAATDASPSTLRAVLAGLVEVGLLEVRGTGRARRFHLASAYFRATGSAAAYVRVRGTELIQQEQMVTEYLRAFGSVTRAKTAELCLIPPAQATQLLKRLVGSGVLELRGDRRTSHYVLAPPG